MINNIRKLMYFLLNYIEEQKIKRIEERIKKEDNFIYK